jgi:hypothetical protein
MNNQEITHKDEGGKESFKFTQRGYMWLNPETLKWSYCNPAFSLRSLADIERIVELEKELEKQLKPDLFWPENEGEIGFDDAHEAIGSMVDDYGAILGSMFTLDRAVKLSSQTYVLTEFDESTGSFEFEALKEPKL